MPTLKGQYVIKDVVLISAGLVIGAALRGARLVSEHVRRAEDYTRYGARPTASRVPSRRPRG